MFMSIVIIIIINIYDNYQYYKPFYLLNPILRKGLS